MSAADPAPDPAGPTVGTVLRLAWSILRRHATAFAVLALALAVAPALVLHVLTEAVRRALASPVHTSEARLAAFAVYAAYMGGSALTHVLSFAGRVAMVLVGLEDDRAPGRPAGQASGIVLRFLPVSLATWIAVQVLFGWLPLSVCLIVYVVIGCWSAVIPVYAAERVPIRRLVGRSLAVFAQRARLAISILVVDCAGEAGISAVYVHLDDIFGRSGAANWAGRTAVLSVGAIFGTAVAVTVVALYRELRRVERATPSPHVVEAFA